MGKRHVMDDYHRLRLVTWGLVIISDSNQTRSESVAEHDSSDACRVVALLVFFWGFLASGSGWRYEFVVVANVTAIHSGGLEYGKRRRAHCADRSCNRPFAVLWSRTEFRLSAARPETQRLIRSMIDENVRRVFNKVTLSRRQHAVTD